MPEEIERKYLNAASPDVRPLLVELGAKPFGGPHFESNILYDLPDGSLRAQSHLLRLRTRRWKDKADARLTFKAEPKMLMLGGTPVKRREELELGVDDAKTMHAVLLRLGYRETARYEKVRESWHLADSHGAEVHVDMDRLPFMHCVEIEAPLESFQEMEEALHLAGCPVSAASYHTLYCEFLAGKGLPAAASFVFDGKARAGICAELGITLQALF